MMKGGIPVALFSALNRTFRSEIKRQPRRQSKTSEELLQHPREVRQNFRFAREAIMEVLFYLALPAIVRGKKRCV